MTPIPAEVHALVHASLTATGIRPVSVPVPTLLVARGCTAMLVMGAEGVPRREAARQAWRWYGQLVDNPDEKHARLVHQAESSTVCVEDKADDASRLLHAIGWIAAEHGLSQDDGPAVPLPAVHLATLATATRAAGAWMLGVDPERAWLNATADATGARRRPRAPIPAAALEPVRQALAAADDALGAVTSDTALEWLRRGGSPAPWGNPRHPWPWGTGTPARNIDQWALRTLTTGAFNARFHLTHPAHDAVMAILGALRP
jgi:hypothetical protein